MRLATYNIWNDKKTIDRRLPQLIEEITAIDADIIGLQEVTQPVFDALAEGLGYVHHTYAMYQGGEEGHGDAEGLALFSKFPMEDVFFLNTSAEYANSDALHVLLRAGGLALSVTNLHLPWDSALAKERQIAAIDRYINPRWTDNTTEIPMTCDRILICAGGERLDNVGLFGTAISPETGLSASDHYGVLADVEF